MDFLDSIFCFVMAGFGLDVGLTCSGARTFMECQAMACIACLLDRRISWRIFAFAACVALLANILRCAILVWWHVRGLPHFEAMHDYGGSVIVMMAFTAILFFNPRKK